MMPPWNIIHSLSLEQHQMLGLWLHSITRECTHTVAKLQAQLDQWVFITRQVEPRLGQPQLYQITFRTNITFMKLHSPLAHMLLPFKSPAGSQLMLKIILLEYTVIKLLQSQRWLPLILQASSLLKLQLKLKHQLVLTRLLFQQVKVDVVITSTSVTALNMELATVSAQTVQTILKLIDKWHAQPSQWPLLLRQLQPIFNQQTAHAHLPLIL